jgi:uncharacterized protein YqeY
MSLEQKVKEQMAEAMKTRNRAAINAFRLIQAALKDKKEAERTEVLSEAEVIRTIQRVARQNRDVHENMLLMGLYHDNEDAIKMEEEVLTIMERLLPEQISPEELHTKLKEIIAQLGASSLIDFGRVIRVAQNQLGGIANDGMIAITVKQLLAGA